MLNEWDVGSNARICLSIPRSPTKFRGLFFNSMNLTTILPKKKHKREGKKRVSECECEVSYTLKIHIGQQAWLQCCSCIFLNLQTSKSKFQLTYLAFAPFKKDPLQSHKYWQYYCLRVQCLGGFLGIIGRYPSVSKSNRFHFNIFQFSFIKTGHIL